MENEKYAGKKIFGAAIKFTGDMLKPFLVDNDELRSQVDAVSSEQDMMAWYPLSTIVSLFEVASEHDFLERLASTWSIQVVREMRKQGTVRTPLEMLQMLEASFPLQHQGDVGTMSVRVIDRTSVELTDNTYAPCGYLITLAQSSVANFGAKDTVFEHASNTCRKRGGSSCTYTLKWEESDLLKMWSDKKA